jgi:hypothetical protein
MTADNYGDLGFGDGYAYAQDNVCRLMREVVASNGQTARYFGEEGGGGLGNRGQHQLVAGGLGKLVLRANQLAFYGRCVPVYDRSS